MENKPQWEVKEEPKEKELDCQTNEEAEQTQEQELITYLNPPCGSEQFGITHC